MASSLCSKSVSGFLNSTTSTLLPNSGNLTLQKACHGLQLQTRVGVYETQRHSPGKTCLKCTAGLHMQDGSSLPKNPRRRPPSEDVRRKDTEPKLHRGWYPGQRTQPPPEGNTPAEKDSEATELPFLRKLISNDETPTRTQHYRRPKSSQPSAGQRREFLFDAEDNDEFLSDGEEDSDDEEDGHFEDVEDRHFEDVEVDQFVAERRAAHYLGNPDTDLNCKHFSRCSGCVIDVSLDQPPVMNEARAYFAGRGVPSFSLASGSLVEWRCRAKLAVRGTAENPQIGLFEEGTHSIVDIPSCRTHHPSINDAVKLVKQAIRDLGVQPYDENRHTGELRYVQMVVTTLNTSIPVEERYARGKVQISLVWNARDSDSVQDDKLRKMAEMIWRRGNSKADLPIVHSVWANFQTSRTNVILGGRWRHLMGESELWERVGGVDIAFTPASFGQANTQAFEALLRRMQKVVKVGSRVVELYAGVGAIGLSLAATRKCRVVKCVEVNKEAKPVFERSLTRLPPSVNAEISWHCADVSVSPINWLEGSDVVIVDPPRKGLDLPVVEALRLAAFRGLGKKKAPSSKTTEKVEKRPWIVRAKQSGVHKEGTLDWEEDDGVWPGTLIYVSCGWQAFKLDHDALVEGNAWHLDTAHAFNFFPGTNSIEILAVFKRGKKLPKKPVKVKKGSGVRSSSAKSLRFTKAGTRLAHLNEKLGNP
ncbi:uncharacterized protein [Physcomitrium patens]|uniref:Methyltransferase small domain-containing protein n=1 Tax=Physcomitrium patens TaxID=3218 RepID=A0A2K1JZN9_PHYPA|nr:uncharacterized protein LOC112287987 [Physcomitrium patens]PNR46991.1 hypothetical protein PHYPA_014111 [Physcomitrium patens]|eukprot:XP_024387469.1 uncharacterized protein LOC112287987 [Physcomitrella patens]